MMLRPQRVVAALALGFVAFTVVVALGWLAAWDVRVLHWAYVAWSGWAYLPVSLGSALGSVEVTSLVVLLVGVWLWRQRRLRSLWALLAFVVAGFLEVAFKETMHHPSPPSWAYHGTDFTLVSALVTHTNLEANSYPSGHVLRAAVAFGLAAVVLWQARPSLTTRRATALGLGALWLLVGFCRIYQNAHWFTDVIGAYLLGALVVTLAAWWVERNWADPV